MRRRRNPSRIGVRDARKQLARRQAIPGAACCTVAATAALAHAVRLGRDMPHAAAGQDVPVRSLRTGRPHPRAEMPVKGSG